MIMNRALDINHQIQESLIQKSIIDIKENNKNKGFKYAFVRFNIRTEKMGLSYHKIIDSNGFLSNEDIHHQQMTRINLA